MKYIIFCLLVVPAMAFAGDGGLASEWAGKIVGWGTSIIGVASMVTALTPTKKDNAVLAIGKVLLEALAFNFGHAKSKD